MCVHACVCVWCVHDMQCVGAVCGCVGEVCGCVRAACGCVNAVNVVNAVCVCVCPFSCM